MSEAEEAAAKLSRKEMQKQNERFILSRTKAIHAKDVSESSCNVTQSWVSAALIELERK